MNLIICSTPLHVLIAEKIMNLHPNEKFFGVMFYSVKNEKFEYYKNRLKNRCEEYVEIFQHRTRIKLFSELLFIKRKFIFKKFDNVFVASINELSIQTLLSTITFKTLNTFDDGTANIIHTSFFYNPEPNTRIRKTINKLFGNQYNTQMLIQLSKNHYSLYRDLPNIIEKVTFLDLLADKTITNGQKSEQVNLFLGQPIYNETERNIALTEKIIQKFNITHYFPHPRETYRIPNVNYVESKLIFEDYLIEHLATKNCKVYSCFSTAILNVMGISENIEVISLLPDLSGEYSHYLACYEIFEKLNIKIIKVE